ncbi:branched-chain amino acid ABC transporter permease [Neopusillimonas maritima]|uniref:Branched-chain amino acid ABC transporter permease n=1 Tax=Neopusillimonas maritima TaxID=2026239 RepID=A0ABX9MW00_9BURK|nr:branched-chain amino acid ABC transporter permease [Neopusillimonas maritima]MBF22978.1 branched-chain amino acid ABC transporter permease [Pusillimonas sp.]RII83145.1 branched-chain amino acid ABC transporter permease [Neopusillimonas maritima]
MELITSILIDGLAYGMILFIISVGLSITMGLMRVVNLAHGVFAMLGGFFTVAIGAWLGLPVELSALLAIVAVGILALPLEKFIFRLIYGRSELQQVLLTIGLVFIGIAATGTLFGNALTAIQLPLYMQQSIDIGFRVVPAHRVAVVIAGFAVLAGLWWLFTRTRFGINIRASVDKADAAEAVGIDTSKVYQLGFMLGAALAALGGILGAELLPIEPYYPLKYLVLVLAIVAVGGMGSVFGSFLAALILGTVETAAKYLMPEVASIVFYLTMLAVLSWRPQGLFGRSG